MAIGRSEDRDNPGNPAMLRHHVHVRDPIRVTHLGQRSCDRTTQAGHMTAIDQDRHPRCTALARRGPSTYGFRPCPCGGVPERLRVFRVVLNQAHLPRVLDDDDADIVAGTVREGAFDQSISRF